MPPSHYIQQSDAESKRGTRELARWSTEAINFCAVLVKLSEICVAEEHVMSGGSIGSARVSSSIPESTVSGNMKC